MLFDEKEDIEYLLYHLIDKPAQKKREEYYREHGYPSDWFLPIKPKTDPEIIEKLRQALCNITIPYPILEINGSDAIVEYPDDEKDTFILPKAMRSASTSLYRLKSLKKATIPTKKLKSLIDEHMHNERFTETENGCRFTVGVPLLEVLKHATFH
jgi:hypothetical protein